MNTRKSSGAFRTSSPWTRWLPSKYSAEVMPGRRTPHKTSLITSVHLPWVFEEAGEKALGQEAARGSRCGPLRVLRPIRLGPVREICVGHERPQADDGVLADALAVEHPERDIACRLPGRGTGHGGADTVVAATVSLPVAEGRLAEPTVEDRGHRTARLVEGPEEPRGHLPDFQHAVDRLRVRGDVLEHLALGGGRVEAAVDPVAIARDPWAALRGEIPPGDGRGVDRGTGEAVHVDPPALAAGEAAQVRRGTCAVLDAVAVDRDLVGADRLRQHGDRRNPGFGGRSHRPRHRFDRRRLQDDDVGLLLDEGVELLDLLGDVEVAARRTDNYVFDRLVGAEHRLEGVDDLYLEVVDQLPPGDGDGVRPRVCRLPVRPPAGPDVHVLLGIVVVAVKGRSLLS